MSILGVRLAVLLYERPLTRASDGLGQCAKRFDTRSREARIPPVIVRRPHEELARAKAEDPIEVRRCTDVYLRAGVADPAIRRCVLEADCRSVVRRGVVGDHEFETADVLGKQRVQRLAKMPGAVVDREPDAENRARGHSLLNTNRGRIPGPASPFHATHLCSRLSLVSRSALGYSRLRPARAHTFRDGCPLQWRS
jgi:hypothetical protein